MESNGETAEDDAPPAVVASLEAGLEYVTDGQPGIRRRARRGRFEYTSDSGEPVRDAETLQRIKLLAVPPAWADVWIAPTRNGHIQATGRDQRGRKQYRYHARWREVRDESKFSSLIAFGEALPGIRAQVDGDLELSGLPRDRVLATVVRLLDLTAIRVGNKEYARTNGSYGLTTLRDRHARFGRGSVTFAFLGKSGKKHSIEVQDARLARIVRRCRDLPGYELFQYRDPDGQPQAVTSSDVNRYIRGVAGEAFTAKHFRTWDATLLAAIDLAEAGVTDSRTAATRNVTRAMERAAAHLGNTVTVCRKSYVHPAVVEAYLEGRTIASVRAGRRKGLRHDESALLALLKAEAGDSRAELAG